MLETFQVKTDLGDMVGSAPDPAVTQILQYLSSPVLISPSVQLGGSQEMEDMAGVSS